MASGKIEKLVPASRRNFLPFTHLGIVFWSDIKSKQAEPESGMVHQRFGSGAMLGKDNMVNCSDAVIMSNDLPLNRTFSQPLKLHQRIHFASIHLFAPLSLDLQFRSTTAVHLNVRTRVFAGGTASGGDVLGVQCASVCILHGVKEF